MSAEARKIVVDPRTQFDGYADPDDPAWRELKVGDYVMHRRDQHIRGVITQIDPIRSTGHVDIWKDQMTQADIMTDEGKPTRLYVQKLVKLEEKPGGGKR